MNATASNAEHHARLVGQRLAPPGTNWKFDELAPHLEGGDEEVVDAGDARSPASSSLACEPPFSPVTSTSVIAVASGYGNSPCVSRTK